jgi:integrase
VRFTAGYLATGTSYLRFSRCCPQRRQTLTQPAARFGTGTQGRRRAVLGHQPHGHAAWRLAGPQRRPGHLRRGRGRLAPNKTPVEARTLADYEGILRARLLPYLATTPVAKILPATVEALLADLQANGAKPDTVRNTFFTLQSIMRLAVRNRLVGNNPCEGVELPRSKHQEMQFLNADQVAQLARYTAEPYPVLIYTAAYCGLRAGELGALRVKHLDLLRRRIHVKESLAYVERKDFVFGPTKTHETRVVPIPPFLADMLAAYPKNRPHGPEDLVFTARDGSHLKHNSFYRGDYKPAVRHAGLPENLRFHDQRHTCAALLIAQGAHPRPSRPSWATAPLRSRWTATGTCSPTSWIGWPAGSTLPTGRLLRRLLRLRLVRF